MNWALVYAVGFASGVITTLIVSAAAARWALRTITTTHTADGD